MAFLRFSRDKRGYEHFYIVQPGSRAGRGKSAGRVLYWFRTPPNVRVGRDPFDPAIRHALEQQNPGVHFDWKALLSTPIPPPPEVERWRERRRPARAARTGVSEEDAGGAPELEAAEPEAETEAAATESAPGPTLGEATGDGDVEEMAGESAGPDDESAGPGDETAGPGDETAGPGDGEIAKEGEARAARRRRRRRRRRGGNRGGAPQPPPGEV